MKNKYYIFRHGETYASKNNVDYGLTQYSAEILPEGIGAVRLIGEYLKSVSSDKNLTSELLRCVQTSNIIAKISGKKFEKYPLLNEYLENSFSEFRARVKRLVEEFETESGRTYLLCTHGAVISALKYLLTEGKYEEQNLMDYPKTGTLLIITENQVDLLDFNTP